MMGFQEVTGWIICFVVSIYSVVILYITFGLTKLFAASPKAVVHHSLPLVSVLVPVRNEAESIRECLRGLINQDYPKSLLEIIVTDDFSEDYTLEFAHIIAKENPGIRLLVISSAGLNPSESGKKRALERAIQKTSGELILCTDADTSRGAQWVLSMAECYRSGKYRMIIGPVAFSNERSLLQKIQSLEFMGLIGITAGSSRLGFPVMCNGANVAYGRETYLEAGGFRNNLQFASGDDQFLLAEVNKRFGSNAITFLFKKEAVVFTEAERSLGGFINQRLRWVSKSRGYREPAVVALALLTYGVHFLLLLGMVAGLFLPGLLLVALLLWIVKILIDYPSVWLMARFLGKKELLGYYFIAQVFQLFYVALIGLLGNILPYHWKGRKLG